MIKRLSLLIIVGFVLCSPKVVHVYVTLADNGQGIISFNPSLEDGNNPNTNQYWGALYGIEQFFQRSTEWDLIKTMNSPDVIKRIIFKHKNSDVYLVADAYRGDKKPIQATNHIFQSISGVKRGHININGEVIPLHSNADLLVYMGHHFFYADKLHTYKNKDGKERDVILLACKTNLMCDTLDRIGANEILLTTQFMAPEAYILENVLEGWIVDEGSDSIRLRAAEAYSKYQGCSVKAALGVFTTSCR